MLFALKEIIILIYLCLLFVSFFIKPFYLILVIISTYSWLPSVTGFSETSFGFSLLGLRVIVIAFLFVVSILILKSKNNVNKVLTRLIWIYILVLFVSFFISIARGGGIGESSVQLLKYSLPFMIILILDRIELSKIPEKTLDKYILFSMILGIVNFLYLYFVDKSFFIDNYGIKRLTTNFGVPNSTAFYLVFSETFLLYLIYKNKKKIYLIILFVLIGIIFLTGSRVGLFLSFFIPLSFILLYSKNKILLLSLFAVTVVIFLSSPFFLSVVEKRFLSRGLGGSLGKINIGSIIAMVHDPKFLNTYSLGRLSYWKENLNFITKNILNFIWGSGIGNYNIKNAAHNDYLYQWSTNGVIGLISYISIMSTLFYLSLKSYLNSVNKLDGLLCLIIISFWIFWSTFDNFLYKHDVTSYSTIVVAFYLYKNRMKEAKYKIDRVHF